MEKITKNLIPISIVIVGLIMAGAFVYINQNSSEGISPEQAGEKTISYINENLLAPGTVASLVDISDLNSVYKVHLKIEEGEVLLAEFDSYVSKDGEFLFPEGINMKEPFAQDPEIDIPDQPENPSLPQEELKSFVNCLQDNGVVIYGADWCPYCQQLVSSLGGKEIVGSMYVNCEEQENLCQEKEIGSYPTILINDQKYEKSRSFEAFAQETGCFF